MTNEEMALTLSRNRKQLKQRLLEAKSVLIDELRRDFGKGVFDFVGQRLIGDNGVVLQWQLRPNPDAPPSYHNQQTSRGDVVARRLEPGEKVA